MYTYTLVYNSSCILRSDGAYIPPDPDNTDYQTYLAYLAAGGLATPAAEPAVTQSDVSAALQAQMDATAQAHLYEGLTTACSYAAQPIGAPFQAEGAAFSAWRSAVWSWAFALYAQVTAGTATLPAPADAVAQMPQYTEPS
jgi:hypothetical protein